MSFINVLLMSCCVGLVVYLVVSAIIATYFRRKTAYIMNLLAGIGKGLDAALKAFRERVEELKKEVL